jgi:hypothetical protein
LFKIIIEIETKMLALIKNATSLTPTILKYRNVFYFSKEAKPAKGGKGDAPSAPAAPVNIEPPLE